MEQQRAHLVFVSSNYPSPAQPTRGVFVQQLVRAVARRGVVCSVISPRGLHFRRGLARHEAEVFDRSEPENPIHVLYPRFLSWSNRQLFWFNSFRLTQRGFTNAVSSSLSKLRFAPTLLYGHFLYPNGKTAVDLASSTGCGCAVAVGESSAWSVTPVGIHRAQRDFSSVDHVVAVSTLIKRHLVEHLEIPEAKIGVFPNGVDLSVFQPGDRVRARRLLGLPQDRFIVVFVGGFTERKGPHRVLEALGREPGLGLVFVGEGPLRLESESILLKRLLPHSDIPTVLTAGDVLVLPTLAEGSCNVIVEALACGLPVVTSRGAFNDDLLRDEVAIRVDPTNVPQIRSAVLALLADPQLRERMSRSAVLHAKGYDINLRAERILDWVLPGSLVPVPRSQH